MIKHGVELQPFSTPNYVLAKPRVGLRQDGWQEAPKWPLSEIDADTLAEMCEAFRVEIFQKAGKADPRDARSPFPGRW